VIGVEFGIRYATVTVDDPAAFLAAVRRVAGQTGTGIVLFDADRMAGRAHVVSALVHAARSVERGDPIARTFEMEALLYAAGTRQTRIGRTFGLHDGENRCWIAVAPPDERAWTLLSGLVQFGPEPHGIGPADRRRLCDLFDITSVELEIVGEDRLAELVLERVALLDANR
jgi:KEOPS complex subunit Cgi121